MNAALFIQLLNGLTNLVNTVLPMVAVAQTALDAKTQPELDKALNELKAAVDSQHAKTQSALRG